MGFNLAFKGLKRVKQSRCRKFSSEGKNIFQKYAYDNITHRIVSDVIYKTTYFRRVTLNYSNFIATQFKLSQSEVLWSNDSAFKHKYFSCVYDCELLLDARTL
jgi:hypothetical protein